jgi:hypothetical protein
MATATLPNVCKMPGPPAPFVPVPLPNIGMSSNSPQGYSKSVAIEGNAVAIQGASFGSVGDVASQGSGGGIVSSQVQGRTTFIGPGSLDVKIEGKSVHLLSDSMLNNGAPEGAPNAGTMSGVVQAPGMPGPLPSEVENEETLRRTIRIWLLTARGKRMRNAPYRLQIDSETWEGNSDVDGLAVMENVPGADFGTLQWGNAQDDADSESGPQDAVGGVTGPLQFASDAVVSISGAVTGAAQSVSGAVAGAAQSVSGAVAGAAQSVSGAVAGAAQSVASAVAGAAQGVVKDALAVVNDVTGIDLGAIQGDDVANAEIPSREEGGDVGSEGGVANRAPADEFSPQNRLDSEAGENKDTVRRKPPSPGEDVTSADFVFLYEEKIYLQPDLRRQLFNLGFTGSREDQDASFLARYGDLLADRERDSELSPEDAIARYIDNVHQQGAPWKDEDKSNVRANRREDEEERPRGGDAQTGGSETETSCWPFHLRWDDSRQR